MSTSNDEEDLFEEMNALVRRYGVHNCQKALNAAVPDIEHNGTAITQRADPEFFDMFPTRAVDLGFIELLKLLLLGEGDPKISLRFSENSDPVGFGPIFQILEMYYDSIVYLKPVNRGPENIRMRSRFRTLCLRSLPLKSVRELFARPKVIALFENVVVRGKFFNAAPIAENSMVHIKDLIVSGEWISSLTFSESHLGNDDVVQFAGMLEVNHLTSLEVFETITCGIDRRALTRSLADSLSIHARTFAEASTLRILDLGRLVACRDSTTLEALFDAIGTLPRLESFGITLEDPCSLEILTGGIVQWKTHRFKLCCHFDIAKTDFTSVFDAIAKSRCIRVFSFAHLPVVQNRHRRFPMDVARQVLNFALSSAHDGLLELSCHGVIDLAHITTLLPEVIDRQVATKNRLRRFVFVSTSTSILWEDTDLIIPKLQALLQLVSIQLPYLHDVGVTNWGHYKDLFSTDEVPGALDLLNEVLTQMDDNQVGMTLLASEVIPTVPAGLWSIVLQKAVTCRNETDELPWSSIFKMVQKMVQVGAVGSIE